jgi:hypothetical protein
VLYPRDSRNAPQWNELDVVAQPLTIQLHKIELEGPNDIETAFQAATKERAEALLAQAPAILLSHRAR